jgi:hypothetical protein
VLNPRDFGRHLLGEHEPPHSEVGGERPKRVAESGRLISLGGPMADPGQAVATDWHEGQQPPAAGQERGEQQAERDVDAPEVQQPGERLFVLAESRVQLNRIAKPTVEQPLDGVSGKNSRILAFAARSGRGKIGEEEKGRNLAGRAESSRLAK